ncbi:MAG: Flp pilus assembly complex ATPase component TadA [Proteobacteria bacterium]|nr:Flp pilus assembly complex ATPase component TadA [Pseudomonadota bacterium]
MSFESLSEDFATPSQSSNTETELLTPSKSAETMGTSGADILGAALNGAKHEAVGKLNHMQKKYEHSNFQRVDDLLLSKGLISRDQIAVAQKELSKSSNTATIGEILVELGFITHTALAEVLSEASGIRTFDINASSLDVALVRRIPKNVAQQHKIIPIAFDGHDLTVATPDVYNIVAFDQIKKYFNKQIVVTPQFANEGVIAETIDRYFEYEMSITGILREIEEEHANNKTISGEESGYVNPTVRLVDAIFSDAIKRGVSDIHFEPEQNFVRLRYRIDGILQPMLTFHKDYWPAIAVRIKIVAGMNIAETRNPQDGRIGYNVLGRSVDFRVSSQPTVYGENIVARILDKSRSLMSIDELGLSDHNKKQLLRLLKRPEGIVILTGPTGCGKTTTLYSVLNYLNKTDVNIMTLEDPVEYQLPLIRQSGVKDGTSMSFANGVRSMLRQDPDIIFVGEVRDPDTATMTIRAAMTGHLVFTTLHTNDALGIIPRLVDLGIRPALLSGSIICSIAQRLARRLCSYCKEEYTASAEDCQILGLNTKTPPKLWRHIGCEHCYHSGYKGRIAIHEVLAIDREIDDMIAHEASHKEIMRYAENNGFISMASDGIQKALAGTTDVEELINTVNLTHNLH